LVLGTRIELAVQPVSSRALAAQIGGIGGTVQVSPRHCTGQPVDPEP
jgi:hypothetical protein